MKGSFMRHALRNIAVFIVLLTASGNDRLGSAQETAAQANPASVETRVRVLAVGNSFTSQIVPPLRDLVKAAGGDDLTVVPAIINGSSLEMHVRAAELHEQNPDDPQGRPYAGNKSLRDLLQQDKWDHVTIQQLSGASGDVATYRPWARQLHDCITKSAPQAEVLINQTWAWRDDDLSFQRADQTADGMYRQLRAAYDTIAEELGCRVIRVGDAFQLVRQSPGWHFEREWTNIDTTAFTYPDLPPTPVRSLHTGWKWMGQKSLANDTHHASRTGSYLAACVWFEFLLKRSVLGNSYVPEGISKEDARFLQQTAHQVVSENVRPPAPERL